jgi:hypothetical protein
MWHRLPACGNEHHRRLLQQVLLAIRSIAFIGWTQNLDNSHQFSIQSIADLEEGMSFNVGVLERGNDRLHIVAQVWVGGCDDRLARRRVPNHSDIPLADPLASLVG